MNVTQKLRRNEMLNEIAKLRKELEAEIGESLSDKEIAYFEQIVTLDDLKNYGDFEDLAYDAAIALGLADAEAEEIVKDNSKIAPPPPQLSEELIAKYQSLVQDVNLLDGIVYDAEYQMTEEISAEGFVASETRIKVNQLNTDLAEAKRNLEIFKYENSSFVARYKAMRKEEKESKNEEMFEKFWNN